MDQIDLALDLEGKKNLNSLKLINSSYFLFEAVASCTSILLHASCKFSECKIIFQKGFLECKFLHSEKGLYISD